MMDKVEVTQAARVRDALMDAYISGAQEVHDAWVNCGGRCPGERDDLGEGASDYVAGLDIAHIAATPAPSPDLDGLLFRFERYADILDADETRAQGRAATNTWAAGFREAVTAITALRGEVEAARLSERARIVAFLRKHPGDHARVFAKAVDDGEHTPIG